MKITNKINTTWSDYDKTVAKCQLSNYGKIFLDEYDLPLDNDHLIEDHIQNFAGERKRTNMKKFYWESAGECITQVDEIEATDWEDAKRKAFPDMCEGDWLAECPPEAVKEYGSYPGYYYIDKDLCNNCARLERGTWASLGKGEYWEDRVWWFSDADEVFWGGDGLPFTDWRTEEDEE